jgi:hypothetical protein
MNKGRPPSPGVEADECLPPRGRLAVRSFNPYAVERTGIDRAQVGRSCSPSFDRVPEFCGGSTSGAIFCNPRWVPSRVSRRRKGRRARASRGPG